MNYSQSPSTSNSEPLRPLSEGNRFQRAYARWAAPHYARMPHQQAAEAQRLDSWLYSRRALGFWLGLTCALVATGAGLRQAGLPLVMASVISLMVWFGFAAYLLKAWLQPEKYTGLQLLRMTGLTLTLGYLGMVCGFLLGRYVRNGSLSFDGLSLAARDALVPASLLVAVFVLVFLLMGWGVGMVRRQQIERQLTDLQRVHERDHAARQVSEAKLQLLQAQIQPHFIFNTLAAVQHWVDTADPRAGPLLRSLTSFLRGSTDLLGRAQASVADEAALAEHYLAIMQARLGGRLQYRLAIAPSVAVEKLPPGLLLSLVENAVEHGITPTIAGGTVQISGHLTESGFALCVQDDGVGLPADWQQGTGLANCRQRLAFQFGERAVLSVQPQAQAGPDTEAETESTGPVRATGTCACINVQRQPASAVA